MKDIRELIDNQSCHAQGSLDWFRDRLGCITSSEVYKVMLCSKEVKDYEKLLSTPLKKGETDDARKEAIAAAKELAEKNPFSDTAKGYLHEVAAERNLQKRYVEDDDLFREYLERVDVYSKAIRYGSENEGIAREIYMKKNNAEVVECGFIRHIDIDKYGDSPDGIVLCDGIPVKAIEIKFPNPNTWISYATNITGANSLKEEKPEYYWQCMSHIECCRSYFGCNSCDFIFCDKMQKNGYKEINILPNEDDILLMKKRIVLANAYIDEVLSKIK